MDIKRSMISSVEAVNDRQKLVIAEKVSSTIWRGFERKDVCHLGAGL